jgi:1-pyrroline-5-carboxylate dehydrogenase
VRKVLELEGAKLLFGGKKLPNTNIPECYGSYEPTAIFVPLNQFENHFELLTTELFGPF